MKNGKFIVEGLGGERRLRGSIPVRGAKNAVVAAMPAAFLFKDALTLRNVPEIEDVDTEAQILRSLGAKVSRESGRCTIDTGSANSSDLDAQLASKIRASIVFAGPLLGRFGKVSFPHPGGDVIGPRPINLFLDGFRKMGCTVEQEGDSYRLAAPQGLKGAEIFFLFVSVTATETLMMAAVLAEGTTVLKNAAMEPEIVSLAEFLISCGAKIRGAGTPTIEIEGGGLLSAAGKEFHIIPDRIEMGTFMLFGALAAEELEITECNPAHGEMLMSLLRESGVSVETSPNSLRLRSHSLKPKPLVIRTHEYPGFPTDLQPPMVVYLTQTEGESSVFETIWGGRLLYIQDLVAMGASITVQSAHQAAITGPTPLVGRSLKSPDIRAGLAYLLAATVASGRSSIDGVYHIDRGYERIEERLQSLGLNIRRE